MAERKRTAGGRFAKGRTKTVTRYKTKTVVRRARRRKGSAGKTSRKETMELCAASAGMGYLQENVPAYTFYASKLPVLGNRKLSVGIAVTVINQWAKSKWLDRIATSSLIVGAHTLGMSGLKMSGEGGGFIDDELDASEVSGSIGAEDAPEEEDELY